MSKREKRVLVAGGAGFIGSNLCRRLIENGAQVDCVDNLITGRVKSVSHLKTHTQFRFFVLDVTESSFVGMFKDTSYDEIYHLACPTGVPNIEVYGEQMLQTSSVGTENLLQLASIHGARFLFASSAEVYGDPEIFPQREDYSGNVDPIGPRSAYEEGKRFAEALIKLYAEKYEVEAKIARIFNTFGLGMAQNDTRVIPHFLKNIKENRTVPIYGDGLQTRTYLYVDDLIDGLLLVMAKGRSGAAYNIGGQTQLSIKQLVEIIKNLTDLDVHVEYKPHFIEDHSGRLPSTSKVQALGWKPRVDITEGLRRMLVSYLIPLRQDISATEAPYQGPERRAGVDRRYGHGVSLNYIYERRSGKDRRGLISTIFGNWKDQSLETTN